MDGVVEALRAGECVCVCVYRRGRSQTTEGVRDVGGLQCNCAGGRGAWNCAGAGYGVAAYDVSDYGDEAFCVGDCGFAGLETEGYDDDGGGVGWSVREELEPGSD